MIIMEYIIINTAWIIFAFVPMHLQNIIFKEDEAHEGKTTLVPQQP